VNRNMLIAAGQPYTCGNAVDNNKKTHDRKLRLIQKSCKVTMMSSDNLVKAATSVLFRTRATVTLYIKNEKVAVLSAGQGKY